MELYPADPAAGSPFGTGDNFTFTPVYKRLAAFQGDFIFQATRRFLLDQRSGKQVARSFCGWFCFARIGVIADRLSLLPVSERNKVTGLGAVRTHFQVEFR